jgi:fido (protein-threonine AMPylation protein)
MSASLAIPRMGVRNRVRTAGVSRRHDARSAPFFPPLLAIPSTTSRCGMVAAPGNRGFARPRFTRHSWDPKMSLPGFAANACLYRTANQYRTGLRNIPLTESDVRNLHRLAMQRERPDIAGQYSNVHRYVRTKTGRHGFPPPAEIRPLMHSFGRWLGSAPDTPETAFAAHRYLVDIHPFNDGNGRTARLLMNLVLTRGGYPPIVVRPEDRLGYLRASQQSQAGCGSETLDTLLYDRLRATIGIQKAAEKKR